MVEGDIEKFSALMSILTKAQIDCAVVIYDIFGNEAAFVFSSFVSAYQAKKIRSWLMKIYPSIKQG